MSGVGFRLRRNRYVELVVAQRRIGQLQDERDELLRRLAVARTELEAALIENVALRRHAHELRGLVRKLATHVRGAGHPGAGRRDAGPDRGRGAGGVSDLAEYVRAHTDRGECDCGKCIDRGAYPDPTGHVADVVFFKVAAVGNPDAETFRRLTAEHPGDYGPVDPFDGAEHNFLELGAWIGNQGLAMQYMALGALLGVFRLLTPDTVLGLQPGDPMRMEIAGAGFVAVQVPA